MQAIVNKGSDGGQGTVPLVAFAASIYLGIAVFFFGCPVLLDPTHYYIGAGQDPAGYMWCLVWWPYALAHKLNPLFTNLIWVPSGANLVWTASIPGPSLFISPLTKYAGPVASFNLLTIAAPATAALAAFLVCNHISGKFGPALVGGYVFGFSSYELGQELSHLSLSLVLCVPLAVYLVLLKIEGRIRSSFFVTLYSIVLAAQFLTATEIFATLALFTAMAMFFATMLLPSVQRRAVLLAAVEVALAYSLCALLVSPLLYHALESGEPPVVNSPELCSTDLLNFVVPTEITYMGSGVLRTVADRINPDLWYSEKGGYLGPLILLVAFFAWRHRREPLVRLVMLLIIAISICSLGPRLHIAGKSFFPLPWALVLKLPLIDQALPIRFTLYVWLLIAIVTSCALSLDIRSEVARGGLALAILLSIAPNVQYFRAQITEVDTPTWFSSGQFRSLLPRDATLLILPFGHFGNSMLWQAQSGMYFKMAEGYISSVTPPEYLRWFSIRQLDSGRPADPAPDLVPFLATHRVYAIVVAKQLSDWRKTLSRLGVEPLDAGDILFYPVHDFLETRRSTR